MQIKTKTETEASFASREEAIDFIYSALKKPDNTRIWFSDFQVSKPFDGSERYHVKVTSDPDSLNSRI